jgi:AhpD family alkylhydroperoxidase
MPGRAPGRVQYEEMPAQLQAQLRPRLERLGYVGEFFQVGANQPEALSAFVEFTEQLKEALPWRLVEVIALTVASETGNAYELTQHEQLALRLGMTKDEIIAIKSGALERSGSFSEAEITAAKLAACMGNSHGHACASESNRLVGLLGPTAGVACVMMSARYLAHAAMANAWQLTPPVPSPFDGDGSDE